MNKSHEMGYGVVKRIDNVDRWSTFLDALQVA